MDREEEEEEEERGTKQVPGLGSCARWEHTRPLIIAKGALATYQVCVYQVMSCHVGEEGGNPEQKKACVEA